MVMKSLFVPPVFEIDLHGMKFAQKIRSGSLHGRQRFLSSLTIHRHMRIRLAHRSMKWSICFIAKPALGVLTLSSSGTELLSSAR
jgi:hypothetical protein